MPILRTTGALATGLALIAGLAACGGGGGGGGDDAQDGPKSGGSSAGSDASQSSSPAAPPLDFDQVKGPSLVLRTNEDMAGLRVKVIDTAWAAQLGDQPAKAGQHFFALYLAVEPGLADRGTTSVKPRDFQLYFQLPTGKCEISGIGAAGTKNGARVCHADPYFGSQLVDPASAPPATPGWPSASVWSSLGADSSAKLMPGEHRVGIVGYPIDDSVKLSGVELCEDPYAASDGSTRCLPVTPAARPSSSD